MEKWRGGLRSASMGGWVPWGLGAEAWEVITGQGWHAKGWIQREIGAQA